MLRSPGLAVGAGLWLALGLLAETAAGAPGTGPHLRHYRAWLASQKVDLSKASIAESADWARGDLRFFEVRYRVIGPPGSQNFHRTVVSAAGVLDDLRPLLVAHLDDAATLARRIEWFRSPSALLTAGAHPSNLRDDPRLWSLITAPRLEKLAGGGLRFVAWYGSPPSFTPYRITLTSPPAGPTTQQITYGHQLLVADADPVRTAHAALRGTDVHQKKWALRLLEGKKDRSALPRIIELLRDPEVELQAAAALGGIGDRAAVPALLAAYATSREGRFIIVIALHRLADPGALKVLADKLSSEALEHVREEIVYFLKDAGGPALRPYLEKAAATDPSPRVRALATRLLGR